jgi:hypothetical protein
MSLLYSARVSSILPVFPGVAVVALYITTLGNPRRRGQPRLVPGSTRPQRVAEETCHSNTTATLNLERAHDEVLRPYHSLVIGMGESFSTRRGIYRNHSTSCTTSSLACSDQMLSDLDVHVLLEPLDHLRFVTPDLTCTWQHEGMSTPLILYISCQYTTDLMF